MQSKGRVLAIGECASRAVSAGTDGEVVAVFSRAAYLDFGGELAVLVPKDVPNGPFHVRLECLPQLTLGMRVRSSSGAVAVADRRWLMPVEPWRPALPPDVLSAEPLVSAMVRHRPVLDMVATSAVDLDDWLGPMLAQGDVSGACGRLFGRGAGLTPSGDDVAAGILLVVALVGSTDPATLRSLAAHAPTHAISRAFLRAAADGQSIEPIHTLLLAASAGDERLAAEAMGELAIVGHTSGLDLAAGVRVALIALAARAESADRAPRDTISIHAHRVL